MIVLVYCILSLFNCMIFVLSPDPISQSKGIYIAPYVASESEAHVGLD